VFNGRDQGTRAEPARCRALELCGARLAVIHSACFNVTACAVRLTNGSEKRASAGCVETPIQGPDCVLPPSSTRCGAMPKPKRSRVDLGSTCCEWPVGASLVNFSIVVTRSRERLLRDVREIDGYDEFAWRHFQSRASTRVVVARRLDRAST
jgi:hypothetical protein